MHLENIERRLEGFSFIVWNIAGRKQAESYLLHVSRVVRWPVFHRCRCQAKFLTSHHVLLRSEIPSGICVKLRTVAASNNRVHMPWSLFAYAGRYVQSLTSSVSPEITRHDHYIIACSRHVYVWCCSSRTSRSWWITQTTQPHRRGCNSTHAQSNIGHTKYADKTDY